MEKEYTPILYILIYKKLKEISINGRVDLGTAKGIMLSHNSTWIRIRKNYFRVILQELENMNLIKQRYKHGYIIINDSKIDHLLENSSKMYRYTGCY